MKKSNIRFLDNMKVEVYKEGKTFERTIRFGLWEVADKVVDTKDGFCDVYLSNGEVLYGLANDVVEHHGVSVVVDKREYINYDEDED